VVDKLHPQLVTGSGEGQNLTYEPKGTLIFFKERDGSLIIKYGYRNIYTPSAECSIWHMGFLDPAWMRTRVYFLYGTS